MLKAVVDTNVIVSALRSKSGASFRLLSLVGDERWRMSLSVPLFLEYEDVLKRPEIGLTLSADKIDDVLNFVCAQADLREIFYLWRPVLPDPKDDFVLELAVESGRRYIVTFNVRDFEASRQFGIEAVTPREFLQKIGELA
ncbi:MAG TPA: putative toxin-antitoxin system toxin component, PIN family [Pyrinomonadaceae bacterium]|jgi:putative PIN family toxin of toxin-antitoxin system|nr:putative toxin-antitoxin system toxin component, PIN family [Pyrinomonadaceae bacterium]